RPSACGPPVREQRTPAVALLAILRHFGRSNGPCETCPCLRRRAKCPAPQGLPKSTAPALAGFPVLPLNHMHASLPRRRMPPECNRAGAPPPDKKATGGFLPGLGAPAPNF